MTDARFNPYPEYKDSGIEWLAEIPAHWDIEKLGWLIKVSNAGEVIDRSYWENGNELLYSCQRTPIWSSFDRFPSDRRTQNGDLLVTRNGTPYVHLPEPGSIYTNVVQRIRLADNITTIFAHTVLSVAASTLIGFGDIIESFNMGTWRQLWLPIPPRDEQTQIADFLDRETAKIDVLVEKKERLIELLKEKRTSLITHAVTKGLDPNVPMKDSDIEWLGKVPAHWGVTRVQHCCDLLVGFAFPSDGFIHGDSEKGAKLLRGDNITTGCLRWERRTRSWPEISLRFKRFLVIENDIVIGMDGSKVGRNYALVHQHDLPLLLVQRVARLRLSNRSSARYLYYSIANPRFHYYVDLCKSDPAIPHITAQDINHFPIASPPQPEQEAIAKYLDRETAKIDALITKIEKAIKLLKEYRTALISAAVTGKIDVRRLAEKRESRLSER